MPFEPGQSGNPAGRPKRAKIWGDAIQRAIKRREDSDPKALEKLADQLLRFAASNDATEAMAALKELGDRLDGKPRQEHEHDASEQLGQILLGWQGAKPRVNGHANGHANGHDASNGAGHDTVPAKDTV
jgi:hypothetical protein